MKSRFSISLLLTMLLVPTFTACVAQTTTDRIAKAEAETIALEHAGFTSDEVTGLYTEYDVDNRIPKYEVQFYQDYWKYEYDIHAETGVILSYDKDDRH